MGQLFSNLIGNALNHGRQDAPVHVQARTAGGMFEFAVSNEGEPISPAAMNRLFQPFFRGDVRASQQGLGLGLHIASEIAKAHRGEIKVTSDAAQTRFTFTMPL